MNSKKLKRIVAMATVMATFLTNSVVSAATTTAQQDDETTISNSSNVLNVDVDDNGTVSYSLPASQSTSREDLPFSWDNASVYFLITDRFYMETNLTTILMEDQQLK